MFSHVAAQWFFAYTAAATLMVSGLIYAHDQNFVFFVEVPCDPLSHECFVRDCEAGECPPYNISTYRAFSIHAKHVDACTDPTCANVCLSELNVCTEMFCSEQDEIECSLLQS